jgi:hypothetical protein
MYFKTFISNISDPLIISNIGRLVIYNNYEKYYNLNMIIDFISSPYGTDYLHHIFISPI